MVGYPCCGGFTWVPVGFPWVSQNRTCPFLHSCLPGFTVSYITYGNIPWEKQLLATEFRNEPDAAWPLYMGVG